MEKVEYLYTVFKTSAEKRPFAIDFSDRLPTGAALSSCAVAAYKVFDESADNSVISNSTATISGNVATIFLQAGTAGQRYRIVYSATLDDSSILVEHVLLSVVAAPR